MPSRKSSRVDIRAAQQGTLVWDIAGLIAGVDEAGRGPLAGPVVAAAVILDDLNPIQGLNDSKKLTALRREKLYDEIRAKAQLRDQTDALKLTQSKLPGANAGRARQASGMRMTIDKSMELPPDENYDLEQ